jgi:hypothetical protein
MSMKSVDAIAVVVDCDCGMTMFNSPPFKVVKKIMELLGAHYPEVCDE